jgi:hypothetical protein
MWPLLFGALAWIACFATRRILPAKKTLYLVLGGIPAIALVVPMAHKIFFAFAKGSTLFVSALLGLLLALLVGSLAEERASKRWILPILLGVGGLGLLIVAVALPTTA